MTGRRCRVPLRLPARGRLRRFQALRACAHRYFGDRGEHDNQVAGVGGAAKSHLELIDEPPKRRSGALEQRVRWAARDGSAARRSQQYTRPSGQAYGGLCFGSSESLDE